MTWPGNHVVIDDAPLLSLSFCRCHVIAKPSVNHDAPSPSQRHYSSNQAKQLTITTPRAHQFSFHGIMDPSFDHEVNLKAPVIVMTASNES